MLGLEIFLWVFGGSILKDVFGLGSLAGSSRYGAVVRAGQREAAGDRIENESHTVTLI